MKCARKTSIIVAASLLFGTGAAVADSQIEYSFLLPGVDYQTDVESEYTGANAEFAVLQSYAGFKPGDLVDFTYDDGAQIQVVLPKQGSICFQGKCTVSVQPSHLDGHDQTYGELTSSMVSPSS